MHSVVYCAHHWSFTCLFCVLRINVISLKSHFLLLSVCSLHRPCEVCVRERYDIDEGFLVCPRHVTFKDSVVDAIDTAIVENQTWNTFI